MKSIKRNTNWGRSKTIVPFQKLDKNCLGNNIFGEKDQESLSSIFP